MTAVTVSPAAEIRRLREENAALRAQLADARRQTADLLDALPDADAEQRWRDGFSTAARWLADDVAERSWAAGYVAAVEDWKRSEHLAVESAWLVAAHFRTIRWPEQEAHDGSPV